MGKERGQSTTLSNIVVPCSQLGKTPGSLYAGYRTDRIRDAGKNRAAQLHDRRRQSLPFTLVAPLEAQEQLIPSQRLKHDDYQ